MLVFIGDASVDPVFNYQAGVKLEVLSVACDKSRAIPQRDASGEQITTLAVPESTVCSESVKQGNGDCVEVENAKTTEERFGAGQPLQCNHQLGGSGGLLVTVHDLSGSA
jgi:hypothetical protein